MRNCSASLALTGHGLDILSACLRQGTRDKDTYNSKQHLFSIREAIVWRHMLSKPPQATRP